MPEGQGNGGSTVTATPGAGWGRRLLEKLRRPRTIAVAALVLMLLLAGTYLAAGLVIYNQLSAVGGGAPI